MIVLALTFVLDRGFSVLMTQLYKGVEIGQSGGKMNYLMNHYTEVSKLAVGNSRCAHHVVPKVLGEKTYNLSHNGMSLIFHTGLIDELLSTNKVRVDTLLLHLEIHELLSPSKEKTRDIQHLKHYYAKNNWIQSELNDLSTFEALKFIFSSYQWNGKIVSLLANRIKAFRSQPPTDGYVSSPPSARDSINVMWQKNLVASGPKSTQSKEINPLAASYIRHIQDLCQKSGTTLICFSSPVYEGSRFNEEQLLSLQAYFHKVDITFFDYSNAYYSNDSLNSIKNWKDLTHLNERGAIVFSQGLRQDLASLSDLKEHNHIPEK